MTGIMVAPYHARHTLIEGFHVVPRRDWLMKTRFIGTLFLVMFGVTALIRADAATEAGAKAYGAKCASCHSKDGKGNPNMAKVFKVEPPALDMTKKETLDKSDADLVKIITDGVNKMPAYKEKLSADDIKATVA